MYFPWFGTNVCYEDLILCVQWTRNEVWSNNISVNHNKTTVVINGVETYTHMHTNVQIEKLTLEILISE